MFRKRVRRREKYLPDDEKQRLREALRAREQRDGARLRCDVVRGTGWVRAGGRAGRRVGLHMATQPDPSSKEKNRKTGFWPCVAQMR
jgi:hypothetical protein